MQTKRQPSSRRPYRIAGGQTLFLTQAHSGITSQAIGRGNAPDAALAAASDKGSGEKGHFQSRASIVFPPEATSEVEEAWAQVDTMRVWLSEEILPVDEGTGIPANRAPGFLTAPNGSAAGAGPGRYGRASPWPWLRSARAPVQVPLRRAGGCAPSRADPRRDGELAARAAGAAGAARAPARGVGGAGHFAIG
uniref:Uncharacterized protein n=1 Tax=Rangifer tarandus platyrhynchus TaxID=3082113 RepID=A0ACB0EXJ1_RANTA|nr:unnamed protein product [Rangifer tarandus platyrhynchus]